MENKNPIKTFISSSMRSTFTVVFFTLFISGLSFLAGSLWTKLMYIENGSAPAGQVQAGADQKDPNMVIEQIAKDLKLDKKKFNACLDNGNFKNRVSDQVASATKAGVSGTPGNFLVNLGTNVIIPLPGAVPTSMLQEVVGYLTEGTPLPEGLTLPEQAPDLDMPNLEKDHIRGNKNARIALIEYSDFSCPFCQRFHNSANELLEANQDKVLWVYRHFPLEQLHPYAQKQAEASECAGQLGGEEMFWKFSDALYANQ